MVLRPSFCGVHQVTDAHPSLCPETFNFAFAGSSHCPPATLSPHVRTAFPTPPRDSGLTQVLRDTPLFVVLNESVTTSVAQKAKHVRCTHPERCARCTICVHLVNMLCAQYSEQLSSRRTLSLTSCWNDNMVSFLAPRHGRHKSNLPKALAWVVLVVCVPFAVSIGNRVSCRPRSKNDWSLAPCTQSKLVLHEFGLWRLRVPRYCLLSTSMTVPATSSPCHGVCCTVVSDFKARPQ